MRRHIVLIMMVAFIAFGAGIVLSKAVKVDLVPYDGDGDESGHAILNYAKGAGVTQIQVNSWGLLPNTEYTVYLWGNGTWPTIGTFITMKNGSGNLHVSLAGDHSEDLPIAVNLGAGGDTILWGGY